MTSRWLSAGWTVAVSVGLTVGAWAQSGPSQAPTRPAGTSGTATEAASDSSQPAGAKDPFDEAAVRSKRDPARDGSSTAASRPRLEKATFGAGCFWHVEAEFEWLPGVKSAVSGYAGGRVPNPSYEMVHEGDTGHIEVVQVEYDPSIISYEQLLQVFWRGHDPTQWNRQGPDVGTQYRSSIFYHNEAQRKAALKSYRELTAARLYPAPIVTLLLPMKAFYRAEEYHQNYYGGKPDPLVVHRSRSRRASRSARRKTGAATIKPPGVANPSVAGRDQNPPPATGRPAPRGDHAKP